MHNYFEQRFNILENIVLWRIFGPKYEVTGAQKNCITRRLITSVPHRMLLH